MAQKQESYFWTSYSDLMTSLFFVMLVLFVLTVVMLNQKTDLIERKNVLIEKNAEEQERIANSTKEQLDKIKEIEAAIENIDPTYFKYEEEYKKHILRINVEFERGSSNINDIPYNTQQELINAGNAIVDFMNDIEKSHNADYLLIIEGQTSIDGDDFENYILSYNRALSLKSFWEENNISFGDKCEVVVSGCGEYGVMRENITNDSRNRRFLIHIIPKPGIINTTNLTQN